MSQPTLKSLAPVVAIAVVVLAGIAALVYYQKNHRQDAASQTESGQPTLRDEATSAYQAQDYDTAQTKLEQAIAEDPQNAELLNFRANVLRDKGDAEEALAGYAAARQLDGSLLFPYVNAISFLINLGRLEEAADLNDEALAVFPDNERLTNFKEEIALMREQGMGQPTE